LNSICENKHRALQVQLQSIESLLSKSKPSAAFTDEILSDCRTVDLLNLKSALMAQLTEIHWSTKQVQLEPLEHVDMDIKIYVKDVLKSVRENWRVTTGALKKNAPRENGGATRCGGHRSLRLVASFYSQEIIIPSAFLLHVACGTTKFRRASVPLVFRAIMDLRMTISHCGLDNRTEREQKSSILKYIQATVDSKLQHVWVVCDGASRRVKLFS